MSNEKIEPGDIVQLKTGGPKMTVSYVNGALHLTGWVCNEKAFGREALKKVEN